MRAASRARSCKLASIKKAKRMRSILLKGFGFTEIAEAEDNACIGYPNLALGIIFFASNYLFPILLLNSTQCAPSSLYFYLYPANL